MATFNTNNKEALLALAYMLERQKDFTSRFIDFNSLTEADIKAYTRDYSLNLMEEAVELSKEVTTKQHNTVAPTDEYAVKMEIIDCFKYVLNLAILWGMDAASLVEAFSHKSQIVEHRHAQVQLLNAYKNLTKDD